MTTIKHRVIRTTSEDDFVQELDLLCNNTVVDGKEHYRIERIDRFAVPYQYTTEFVAIVVLEMF